jgi:hypothetical protein
MNNLRTRWAAMVVALLLLLSAAGVAAAAHVILPATASPQAQEQVAKEHDDDDIDEVEDEDTTTEDEDVDEDADADAQDADGAQGDHGALVSAVAQNKECVGGPHENHGWAVSQVARGLQVPSAGECPEWVPPTLTSETTDENDVTAAPGKSGEHRKDKDKKAKTHGRWASQP